MSGKHRIALVVQRYGHDVTGGAEYHSRWIVSKLKEHFDLTIFTTTAHNYITWEEVYPPGESEIDGVRILRYPVLQQRDMDRFNSYSEWVFNQPHRDVDEERWLEMQGPVCPALIDAIREHRREFDLFFFITYLYYATVKGLEQVPDRAILLPTAHDEQAIRLKMYEKVFASPVGFLLNTQAERKFLENMFDLGHRPRAVCGMGIDWPEPPPDPSETLKKFGIDRPFAISSGRISYGKGHDLVVRNFVETDIDLDLVLFGKLDLELPDDPRIKFIGFVSEEEKWALTRGATVTIHPSLYESLSLTLLESWAMGVPALVNGGCNVFEEHIRLSGGGLAYRGDDEFKEMFTRLATDPAMRLEMGSRGKHYAQSGYKDDVVAAKYVDFLKRMIELRNR